MPRHDTPVPDGVAAIEAIRGPIRRLVDRFPDCEPIDVALGALYASHDLAMRAGMDPHDAVAWIGAAARLMERQLLDQAAAQ